MYRFLADTIVVLHLAYVGFVVLGLLLILVGAALRWGWVRNFWLRGIHFLMIAVVVGESLLDITCPMTTWEDDLRVAAGESVSEGTFIGRFAHRLLFLPENGEATLTAIYCLFGAAVLGTLVWVPPRWPRGLRRYAAFLPGKKRNKTQPP
jgi:hypothetical protein